MARLLKFRAFDSAKKIMYSAEEMGTDQLALSVDGRGMVNINGDDVAKSEFYPHIIPLQFTGRNDTQGREIYEGDVVISSWWAFGKETKKRHVVEYDDERTLFTIGEKPSIIGNIYEHPHLVPEQSV